MKQQDDYSDLLLLEHPTSKRHVRMPIEERAAQFSPFAALTGYEQAVSMAAKESEKAVLAMDRPKEFDIDPFALLDS